MLDISPPFSVEIERSVIGCLLVDPSLYHSSLNYDIQEFDFWIKDHRAIWGAIQTLAASGRDPDCVLISQALGVDVVDIFDYTSSIVSPSGYEGYVAKLKHLSFLRSTMMLSNKLLALSSDPNTDIETIQSAISSLTVTEGDSIANFDDVVMQTFADLDSEKMKPISTGFSSLDAMINGFFPGQLVTVAGRPGMGKTAFMLSVALEQMKLGKKVLFFTLEMGKHELVKRCVSQLSGCTFSAVTTGPGKWQGDVKEKISKAFETLRSYPFFLVEKTLSLQHIISTCKRQKAKGGVDIVMVDYLQLIRPTDQKVNRYEFIGQLTRGLKSAAKDLGVPILQGCQLNRGIESRVDKTARLSDLRESGDIEQDSDLVLFLSRDLEQTSPRSQDATVSVAKHRNGRTGDCEMSYIPSCMQFANKEKGFVPASQVPLSVALPRTSLPKTYDIDDILPDG